MDNSDVSSTKALPRLAVLDIVGLTYPLVKGMPRVMAWIERKGHRVSSIKPAFPAVTCSAQALYLTGKDESVHGVVGNGWYNRQAAEVQFWKQSNHLIEAPKIWDILRARYAEGTQSTQEDQGTRGEGSTNPFTCAQLFWWFNMYAHVDWSATPRPMYPADGRKIFDIYTQPMDLKIPLKEHLGEFPFPSFWGPRAGIPSSRWIGQSAQWIEREKSPTLSFVYLPHLDYSLQKVGPEDASVKDELLALDTVVGDLLDLYDERGVEVVLLSEYGIAPVDTPVHLNRLFREKGWITIKEELGRELLDCGASRVFAVADHQVAHVYINDASLTDEVDALLRAHPDINEVRLPTAPTSRDHPSTPGTGYANRVGDRIAIAREGAWFTYYYWLDDRRAPDFARCIDIHRKPGYDPAELFIDPKISFPLGRILFFLLKKKLGFRALMDVIPLDADLVKGSHGRDEVSEDYAPVVITPSGFPKIKHAREVFSALLDFFPK